MAIIILFDAFQQKFYVETFSIVEKSVPFSEFLISHFIRWFIWVVTASVFFLWVWNAIKNDTFELFGRFLAKYIVLSLCTVFGAIMIIALFTVYLDELVFNVENIFEYAQFFIYQKGMLFFMANSGVTLWLYALSQSEKIDAQWGELDSLREQTKSTVPPHLSVKIGDMVKPLNIEEICWIQADDYCVRIHTSTKSYYLRKTLKFLEAELKPFGFVRIHRGALLNLNFLDNINYSSSQVTLQNKTKIPVSKSGEQLLKKQIKDLAV